MPPAKRADIERIVQLITAAGLREAYVGARYQKEYDITAKDLEMLAEHVRQLRNFTGTACRARIAEIERGTEPTG